MEKKTINCPNCDHEFNVEDVLQKEVEAKIAAKFLKKEKKLKERQAEFEENQERARQDYKKKLKKDREKIQEEVEKQAKKDAKKEVQVQLEKLKEQAEEKEALQLKLQKRDLEFEEQKREMAIATEKAKLDARKEFLEKQEELEKQAKEKAQESFELNKKEFEKKLKDQDALIEEMKRKMNQGSMQLQGEVQELAIEEYLKSQFPIDTIEEIKKGARGGDCIQIVNTRQQANCGKIYYESKRTQSFQPTWIEKFKADMRDKGIDIGVIVTEVMPKQMDRMGIMDGVWICNFQEFKGLSIALREACIRVSDAHASQENKGDKMSLLYDYLTGAEFRMQMEAIIEGFTQMQNDLQKEKNAMARIWKQREKQIDKVINNTIGFYGSLKGIAGNALPTVESLELPYADLDEEDIGDAQNGTLFE